MEAIEVTPLRRRAALLKEIEAVLLPERLAIDHPISSVFDLRDLTEPEIGEAMFAMDSTIESINRKKYSNDPRYCFVCNRAPCGEPPHTSPTPPPEAATRESKTGTGSRCARCTILIPDGEKFYWTPHDEERCAFIYSDSPEPCARLRRWHNPSTHQFTPGQRAGKGEK